VYTKDKNEFEQLFDILINMFIDPIISEDLISKEVNAVDSEYLMHLSNESSLSDDIFNE